jgi:aminopeptidase N
MRRILLTTVFALALAGAAQAEAPFDFAHGPGKLPKTVVPTAYRIDITPDLKALTLTGHESIDIDVSEPVAAIVLDQAGLKLQSATLETGAAAAITLDETAQTATLRFAAPVAKGPHVLSIAYTGPIPESPAGIYYDDYKAPTGAPKRMLVTQFEVSDARRMFPGWDEPAFKATFQLTATLPKAFAAVSNMPIASSTDVGPDSKRLVFGTTPRMSSYLLALVAGDMTAVTGSADGVALGVWAPTGLEDQARYALEAETKLLPYYNAYFGVAYPLPKLDLLAIPGNYAAGAMENWGAITFIDNDLLFDPKTSSPQTRETVFLVVAHEMAHQWSGDLVTLGWWDNTWLNEGFATWMENKATDHFNPDWQFLVRQHSDREQAMGQDALSTTHPIQQPIHDETEALYAFDGISYEKGGQVIRMIEDWLGSDVFRAGMRGYMKAHAYGNTTSADLWAALGAASHRDVAAVAAGFTEQPGIPLVHVARSCTDGKGAIVLSEDRFTIHDPKARTETWTIPVTLGFGPAQQQVMLTEAPASVPIAACDAPVKVNLGESGYYRTQYDAASLAALAPVLARLSPTDRANLLGDQYALFAGARAGLGDYLGLLSSLKDEHDLTVWTDTLGHLRALDRYLQGAPERAGFDTFVAGLLRPQLARLGWDATPGESEPDSLLRPALIAALGQVDDAQTVAQAGRRFHAFLADPASLPPALRDPVLEIVGHHADAATRDALQALGVKAQGTEEKLRYFYAMATASDPDLIRRNVAFALSPEVPNGRVAQYIARISRGSGQADLVYDLVVPLESQLAKRLPGDSFGGTILASAASASADPATAAKLQAAPSSSSPGARIAVARTVDAIDTVADLRARTIPAVAAFLAGGK